MNAPTPLVLCADDYALSPGVSSAIRDLIDRTRLSATSCMTLTPFWAEHASWLKPYADKADIGLHFTLTDYAPLGPMPHTAPDSKLPPLKLLMRRALTGHLDQAEIDAELNRQIDAFEAAFGQPPAFIDGHQHVHQLPTVRQAVMRALTTRLKGKPVYVRLCHDPAAAIVKRGVAVPKALLISKLGGGLRRLARRHHIPGNPTFRGVYDFSGRMPFGTLMDRFAGNMKARGLIMVHPGIPDEVLRQVDPVTDQRRVEYDWLGSHHLPRLLERHNLTLSRFFG